MKGWYYFLAGAACCVAGLFYFHGMPVIYHAVMRTMHFVTAPAEKPAPEAAPTPAVAPQFPPASGICFLTMAVQVPNRYGTLTYQRGTMLHYAGEVGTRHIVQQGQDKFTVVPEMVADSYDEAIGLRVAPAISSTPQPVAALASEDSHADSAGPPAAVPLKVVSLPSSEPTVHADAADFASKFLRISRYLLIADGAEGKGSGCLVKYQGKTMVVTNAHVLSGNPNVKFQQIDSKEVATGPFSFAQGADLAVAPQNAATDGLEIADIEKDVNIGDDVVVLGNSLGSDVVTEINGKVKGIGPSLIEVDAKFVEGNSGSPIIHVKTGKLIGIATFAVKRNLNSLDKDSQFATEWRRFGYRIDTVKAWEHPSLQQFAAEARTVHAVQEQTENLYRIGKDIYTNKLSIGNYQSPDDPLRQIVSDFFSDTHGSGVGSAARSDACMRFERALVFETERDIHPLRQQDFTWFHWHQLQQEIQNREFLKKAYEQLLLTEEARSNLLH